MDFSWKNVLHKMAICLSLFWSGVGLSAPADPSGYTIQKGGLVNIPDGAYIQGSVEFGGIQPDYRIDLNDPALKQFLVDIQVAVRSSKVIRLFELSGVHELARRKKIELVTALVQRALPSKAYDAEPYLDTLKEHRLGHMDISLGTYLVCQAGVCRENALLTHQALKAVGIENRFLYVFAQQYNLPPEDHAIVIVEDKSGRWIVDPYNSNFHGKNLDDLLQTSESDLRKVRRAGFARRFSTTDEARILRINSYPTYWLPNGLGPSKCSELF